MRSFKTNPIYFAPYNPILFLMPYKHRCVRFFKSLNYYLKCFAPSPSMLPSLNIFKINFFRFGRYYNASIIYLLFSYFIWWYIEKRKSSRIVKFLKLSPIHFAHSLSKSGIKKKKIRILRFFRHLIPSFKYFAPYSSI